MADAVIIRGMRGLGDNIYQRGFVRHYPGAYIETPWPEIYQGLDVKFIRSQTRLRTQHKNELRTDCRYVSNVPAGAKELRIGYGAAALQRGSITDAMRRQFAIVTPRFDLPHYGPSPVMADKPIAVIRPATARREWLNTARNPDPCYLAEAAERLQKDFYVVSVADLEGSEEWAVGTLPPADLRLHRGELDICQLLALVQHAAVVVSGVGWAVPAALCYGTPLYVVQGGCGAHNARHVITDPRMDLRRVGWARPDNYCTCGLMQHNCDKRITGFSEKFERWLHETVL
ncbi:hypothetical protein GCM10022405_41080 [Gibbsiella dentisursi]|uniref:Uncharacterized protein n=1 Tax=Gibbsiella dentisursi TaxID=796890 RepID=A0ABP7M0Q9_9GAMM